MPNPRFTDEEIKRIYEEDYIGKHMGCPSIDKKYNCYIHAAFKRLGLPMRNNQEKNRHTTCDSEYFKDINTKEKAYWLGFMMADGFILSNKNGIKRAGLSISEVDLNHLIKFNKAIKSNIPIHTYEVTQGFNTDKRYCRLIISDDIFAGHLVSHGCIEHKSNIIKPPTGVPKELERHFIRGFMDGNGSISISQMNGRPLYKIRFCSTDDMLNWIMDHLIDNSIIKRRYPLTKRKPEHIVSNIEFGGNRLSQKYLDYIYDDATIWLDRKYNRYLDLLELNNKTKYNKKEAG